MIGIAVGAICTIVIIVGLSLFFYKNNCDEVAIENGGKILQATITEEGTHKSRIQLKPATKTYIAKSYKVGSYYDDGEKRGVVFEVSVDGKHGKIVSLTESSDSLKWASNEVEQRQLIGTDDEFDGFNNMAKVKQIAGWQDKYPAFAWCANLGEDWYLPSKMELLSIYKVKRKLNKTLFSKGNALKNGVWSSTERNYKCSEEFCAWSVYMDWGDAYDSYKDHYYYVRAVASF